MCYLLSLFLDGAIVIVVFCFVNAGIKNGFIKSLSRLIGAAIAISLAVYIASFLSEYIYDRFIRDYLVEKISVAIQGATSSNVNLKVNNLFNQMPSIISNSLVYYGITSSSINDTILNAQGGAAVAVADMLSPVVINIIRTIVVSVLFIIFMYVINIAIRTIDTMFRVPVLRQINGLVGALFGGAQAMLIIMIAMFVIQFGLAMIDNVPEIFSESTIQSTYIFKHIYNNNLAYKIFDSIKV